MIRIWIGAVLSVLLTAASIFVYVSEPATGAASAETTPASGANLFRTKGCVACHSARGISSQTNIAPDLTDLTERAGERVAELDAEAYIRQSVLAPEAHIVPGYAVDMPVLVISPEELDTLVDFLMERES